MKLFTTVALAALLLFVQHKHDPNDPKHWYDKDCCSLEDCAPVIETIGSLPDGSALLVRTHFGAHWVPLKFAQTKPDKMRNSQDDRMHVCARDTYKYMDGGAWPMSYKLTQSKRRHIDLMVDGQPKRYEYEEGSTADPARFDLLCVYLPVG